MRRARGAAVVIVGLVVLVLASSNVDSSPASSSGGVSVELLQYRRDEADRRIEVKIDNAADISLHVARVQVVSPRFHSPGPAALAVTVPAGQRVDLRVPYGEPLCSARQSPAGDVVVRLWVGSSNEPTELLPTDGSDVVGRIHERECRVRRVVAVMPLSWSSTWLIPSAGVLDGSLLVGPVAGGHTIEVRSVEGTTLFAVTTTAVPLTLRVGESASLGVRLVPQRCDAHAVGESKRGFDFAVRVAVDGEQGTGPEGALVAVPLQGAGRDLAEQALMEKCGLAGPVPEPTASVPSAEPTQGSGTGGGPRRDDVVRQR